VTAKGVVDTFDVTVGAGQVVEARAVWSDDERFVFVLSEPGKGFGGEVVPLAVGNEQH
jgi:hypothetical protein